MAPRSNTLFTTLSIFFLLAIFSRSSKADSHLQLKETNLTFYIQEFDYGPNATVAIVTGIAGQVWSFSTFGTTTVVDDPITAGPHIDSPQIGRSQGIYITASQDGANSLLIGSIVFTNKEYNGSTLEIQGRYINSLAIPSETAVIGGTGKFRFATGFAAFEIVSFDVAQYNSTVTRCNITVLHY